MRAWLLFLTLAACGGPVDEDGDGATADVDCDDHDPRVHPGAPERCNGIDDDCDGEVDDADRGGVVDARPWYVDADGDGFGAGLAAAACEAPPHTVGRGGDCDDRNANANPEADEICDGIDNDCDDLVDLADPSVAVDVRWYRDADGDDHGNPDDHVESCGQPDGYVRDGTDCDDGNPARNPSAVEVCDGIDNNCDAAQLVDEDDPALDRSTMVTIYADADADGYGGTVIRRSCTAVPGPKESLVGGDCYDGDATRYPGAPETCDAIDRDCDGTAGADEWVQDSQAYRVPLVVTGASVDLEAPPVSFDLDLAAILAAAGDGGTPNLGSLRLVRRDCAAGYPRIPVEFADPLIAPLEHGDPGTARPFEGAVLFRFDTDGVWATREVLGAGQDVAFDLYFSSSTRGTAGLGAAAPPRMTYGTGNDYSIDNGLVRLELANARGGLARYVGTSGGSGSLGEQSQSAFGNGLYIGQPGGSSAWLSAVSVSTPAPKGTLEITRVHSGNVAGAIRSTGIAHNADGAFRYVYTYVVFNGRPEIYAKATFTLTTDVFVGPHGGTWARAVRAWQVDNNALAGDGAVYDPAHRWVRATYDGDTRGVYLGWRAAPRGLGQPTANNDGGYLALAGQDVEARPTAASIALKKGTKVLDGAVVTVLPYEGAWDDGLEALAFGVTEGVSVDVGAAQARD